MRQDTIKCQDFSFNNIILAEAAEKIRVFSESDKFTYVVTPNIDHLCKIYGPEQNHAALPIINEAALSLCDSCILEKMLRIKTKRITEVIPGSTLTSYLFEKTLNPSNRILIFGVEEEHFETLKQNYPDLTLIHINPSMGFINKPDEVNDLLKQVESVNADYIFLSVGAFQQEIFAHKLSKMINARGVGLCVGASISFLVGSQKRAPIFLQKMYLEWAYRMFSDPKRLVLRYFKNFLALPKIYSAL